MKCKHIKKSIDGLDPAGPRVHWCTAALYSVLTHNVGIESTTTMNAKDSEHEIYQQIQSID